MAAASEPESWLLPLRRDRAKQAEGGVAVLGHDEKCVDARPRVGVEASSTPDDRANLSQAHLQQAFAVHHDFRRQAGIHLRKCEFTCDLFDLETLEHPASYVPHDPRQRLP